MGAPLQSTLQDGLPRVHLLQPMSVPTGGGEWRTVELYRLLAPHARVTAWSQFDVHPAWRQQIPIRRLRNLPGCRPRGGTLVIVGPHFWIGGWVRHMRPERIILIYNVDWRSALDDRLRQLAAQTATTVELVFASDALRRRSALDGPVLPSPIDLERFRPQGGESLPRSAVVVGRCSRDTPEKHHPDDRALYTLLANDGFCVDLMGATTLYRGNAPERGIQVRNEGSLDAAEFMRGLDIFFYRTGPDCFETFGRVVFEAMACGLPVVCSAIGGYAEHIEHGRTGFLFHEETEALSILRRLRDDPELRARVGSAARASVERLYAKSNRDTIAFLLGQDA